MRVFLSILLVILFAGCEKYEMVSEPYLTGGRWTFNRFSIEGVNVSNDTLCIDGFLIEKLLNQIPISPNEYQNTPDERRFIVGSTKWSFDNSSYGLYIDDSDDYLWVNFNDKRTLMTIDHNTSYTFQTEGNYALTLTLTKDVTLSNGKSKRVLMYFSRN